jgi:hypothetical protein
MSPAFPRRRAEQFDALLEGNPTETPSGEMARLLALVEDVRGVPDVAPRADFAASLRERLMAEAPTALAVPAEQSSDEKARRLTVAPRTKTSHERRIGVAIAAFSIVGATAASAVASQGSLPGDTLYPVKRLIEDARTSLAMGDGAKADALLTQARTRLKEVSALSGRDDQDAGEISSALQDFGSTAEHASGVVLSEYADTGDADSITELRTFASDGMNTLSGLVGVVPASVNGVLADTAETLLEIDDSAAAACPACAGGILDLPSSIISLLSATTDDTTADSTTDSSAPPPKTPGKHQSKTPQGLVPSGGATHGPVTGGSSAEGDGPVAGGKSGPVKGDKADQPKSDPTTVGGVVGGVGGAVGGTVSGVGGAVSGVGGAVGGPVGGVVSGLGDTVSGLGDVVGGVVGGVGGALDGLLNPTATATPK